MSRYALPLSLSLSLPLSLPLLIRYLITGLLCLLFNYCYYITALLLFHLSSTSSSRIRPPHVTNIWPSYYPDQKFSIHLCTHAEHVWWNIYRSRSFTIPKRIIIPDIISHIGKLLLSLERSCIRNLVSNVGLKLTQHILIDPYYHPPWLTLNLTIFNLPQFENCMHKHQLLFLYY